MTSQPIVMVCACLQMTMIRDSVNFRVFGTFTRKFDNVFKGNLIYRMIGAAGAGTRHFIHLCLLCHGVCCTNFSA